MHGNINVLDTLFDCQISTNESGQDDIFLFKNSQSSLKIDRIELYFGYDQWTDKKSPPQFWSSD